MSQKLLVNLLAEIEKRSKSKFRIDDFCFDKQLSFIKDSSRFKVATCSRRAGKSLACAADLIDTAQSKAGATCLYITLSRSNAKKIIWRALLEIIDKNNIEVSINETDLSLKFPNKSIIYLTGAKDSTEIEKFRGLAINLVYIDEAQSFRSYLKELIDDILVPALYDYQGTLVLIGTPAPVCVGVFYDANHGKGWSKHHWTIMDNPHIELKSGMKVVDILREERERRGIDENDPTYLRESLGQWVNDLNSLVFKYNPVRNTYTALPEGEWNYILGCDIGLDDADAIAVIAYSHQHKESYLVEEYVKAKQDITSLANKIHEFNKKYKPVRIVADTGGLGKKIVEELKNRHGLHIFAAEKSRKMEFIALFNDALGSGNFKIKSDSVASHDYTQIQWDVDKSGKRVVSDIFHSDIADAILYAWRECRNYVQLEPVRVVKTAQDSIDLWEEEQDFAVQNKQNKPWWDDTN